MRALIDVARALGFLVVAFGAACILALAGDDLGDDRLEGEE